MEEQWSLPNWYRWIFVSNDGNYLVTGYDGMNLIPTAYADDLVILTFWNKGKEMRKVTLEEIAPQRSMLERTISHYYWGDIEGINENKKLIINRSDGKTLIYDVTTGLKEE
jgi:hypothetical protein